MAGVNTEEPHRIVRRPLEAFFAPRMIALIGATDRPGSVGAALVRNLGAPHAQAAWFPVNPKRAEVGGRRAYRSVLDVPERPDLAVIATPARAVAGVLAECRQAGLEAAIVLSAGFREAGPEGREREQALREAVAGSALRVIGPNCFGLIRPTRGLNTTFTAGLPMPGRVAFVSQSGALGSAILDWSLKERVGFSAFISVGAMADVGWADLLEYLGQDHETDSILLYIESVDDARHFLTAARRVALKKPILALKAGRTAAAAQAAVSHTGSLTGDDAVWDAVFRRCGIQRVMRIEELFQLAEALGKQPRPRGSRLAIVTNAGGPGVLAADALLAGGGRLATLSEAGRAALDRFLPPHWSRANPIDVIGDASADQFVRAVALARDEDGADAVLAILTPQAMIDPTAAAEGVVEAARGAAKPVLAVWMGAALVAEGEAVLNRGRIPTFPYPDEAVAAFQYMWRYSENLERLYERPTVLAGMNTVPPDRREVEGVIAEARRRGRTLLTEVESKRILSGYGFTVVETRTAATAEEAVAAARALGYPVVLKVHSETLTHKSRAGGVALDLSDDAAVRRAFEAIRAAVEGLPGGPHFLGVSVQPMIRRTGTELILGSRTDAQFGPVMLAGAGGVWTEVLRDTALELPPINTSLARQMLLRLRTRPQLEAVAQAHGGTLEPLVQGIVRFAQLIMEQPAVSEGDVNPWLWTEAGPVVLDARFVLHAPGTLEESWPRPAIRPYPDQYAGRVALAGGAEAWCRPIRPEDEPLLVAFHQAMTDHSVHQRYFAALPLPQRILHERLVQVCWIDYDREMTLVIVRREPPGTEEILGMGQLYRLERDVAEIALVVKDPAQGRGVGRALLSEVLRVARAEGLRRLTADILATNGPMLHLLSREGFRLTHVTEAPSILRAALDLTGP